MSDTGVRLPNEDDAYRAARQELLDAERALRRETERVAALRRALPAGGVVPTDYVFDTIDRETGQPRPVTLSSLFTRPDASLVLYSFMYAEGANPCPMCTSFLDAFDRVVPHAGQRLNPVVVRPGLRVHTATSSAAHSTRNASPIEQTAAWAEKRGWTNLRLLSSAHNTYHVDYLSEAPDGSQIPMVNVFAREGDTVRHRYATELFFAANEPDQHPRHVDPIFPLWNVFDLTPEGRPADWFPSTAYDAE